MRILQITTWPAEPGGAELYVIRTSQLLQKRGHEVAFLVPDDQGVPDTLPENRTVFRLNRARGLRSSRAAARTLEKILKRFNPDLAILHNTVEFFSSGVTRELSESVPAIRHVHDARVFCPRFLSKSLPKTAGEETPRICETPAGLKCFTRPCFIDDRRRNFVTGSRVEQAREILIRFGSMRALGRMRAVIANSGYVRDELIKLGVDGDRIFVTGQILPWPEDDCGIKLYTDKKSPLIGAVGRWDHVKGLELLLDVLIEAASSVSFRAEIAGGGAGLGEAIGRVKAAGLSERIKIRGFVPPGEMPDFYERLDILVFPSLVPETFGLAGIEAQAFGAPVVGFDTGGVRDWLHNDVTGILVPAGDRASLSRAIRQLAESPETRKRLGEKARRLALEKYSMLSHMERLESIFSGII